MKIRIAAVWVVLVGGMVAQIESSSPPTVRGQKAVSSQPAKIDPAKEEDIRKLMNLVGTRTLVLQMIEGMEQNMKPLMSSSLPPGEYRDKLIDLFFAKFHAKASSQQI